jgi:hypothetical protein
MKPNWGKIIAGAAVAGLTLADVIPGDEVVGVPLGVALILDGMGWL